MGAFTLTHIRLLVRDFPAALRFYRDVLGFEVALATEGDLYAEFETGSVRLSIYRQDLMSDLTGTTARPARADVQDPVLLSIHVENVDAAYDSLRAKGVDFVTPPTDQPEWFLRTAHFRDPDGNLIEINRDLPMED